MDSLLPPNRLAEGIATRATQRATTLLPASLRPRLSLQDIPEPLLAVVGGLSVLGRADIPEAVALAPRSAMAAPGAVAGTAADRTRRLLGWVGSAASTATDRAAGVRRSAAATYRGLSEEGRDVVVSYAAERAVRTRVSQMEDRLAPRAGRAAVLLMERRRRVQESRRVRTAGQASQRARRAARRGARRFSELNAPVLADTTGGPQPSAASGRRR